MGQKVNPILFNRIQNKESKFINKKALDHSVLIANNIELKVFIEKFFLINNIIINNCKLLHFNNLFYIYISYQQKTKNNNILKFSKTQIIKNFFKRKKIEIKKNIYVKKKSFDQNLNCSITYGKATHFKKYYKTSIIDSTEICLFIKLFFNSLINFEPNKFKFNIFLTLERRNSRLIVLKKKELLLKRKQKLTMLRKYKMNKFFKGINLLLSTVTAKNSSKFLANFVASQFKTLNFHNFLIRFLKNTLFLLNSKIFLSKIKGIKIVIKGRFNGNPRAKSRLIQVHNLPPLQTKRLKIDYFENTVYTNNGTFGVKI